MPDARTPFFDFDVTKMFADFRFRPFDVEAVWAAQRRNIEALSHANQLAVEVPVSRRDEFVLVGKVMIDETDRHTGLGADGADRQSLVTVALETLDGGRNQRLAPLLRQLALETRFARAHGTRARRRSATAFHATRRSRPRRKSLRISRAAL